MCVVADGSQRASMGVSVKPPSVMRFASEGCAGAHPLAGNYLPICLLTPFSCWFSAFCSAFVMCPPFCLAMARSS